MVDDISPNTFTCCISVLYIYIFVILVLFCSVAPYPQCGPKLNKSGPNYLNIDVNIDSYGGDGPIARVTILYKPSKKPTPWNILVGKKN